jgi:hypothetical protein
MLISKKTHCPKCGASMTRGTFVEHISLFIYGIYSCDNPACNHAMGTILDVHGRRGLEKRDRELFNNGLLGNTYILDKSKLAENFNKRRET